MRIRPLAHLTLFAALCLPAIAVGQETAPRADAGPTCDPDIERRLGQIHTQVRIEAEALDRLREQGDTFIALDNRGYRYAEAVHPPLPRATAPQR